MLRGEQVQKLSPSLSPTCQAMGRDYGLSLEISAKILPLQAGRRKKFRVKWTGLFWRSKWESLTVLSLSPQFITTLWILLRGTKIPGEAPSVLY